ncbi:MAG: leucyl/phenylalanyl-tRNA--protein transferase [Xanthobacteraceae bacterium]|jgi:leucyl/phenylalanyl-tRNA--protein transferase|nr:leucyl/phenylalanyl-tRNA--protein transferase [Xanthobacteraceae bacterium]
MARPDEARVEITPEVLIKAYSVGIFPMAESADDPSLFWVEPEQRGVIPLDGLRVSRRLARTIRSNKFEVHVDRDFDAVIDACAAPAAGRDSTWINKRIRNLYRALFDRRQCHTVEAWRDGRLVGGLYGVKIGAAFFGESMFHFERDASKVALAHLVARLKTGGFKLLDAQFITAHLSSMGAAEVSRVEYQILLAKAVAANAQFYCWPSDGVIDGGVVLQSISQTS